MSRHVIQIGHTPLHRLFVQASPIRVPSNSLRPSVISARPHIAARQLRRESTACFSFGEAFTPHNAAAQNTKARCIGSPAPIASSVGLARSLHHSRSPLSTLDLIGARRSQAWQQQRRLFSENKSSETAKVAVEATKPGSKATTLSEASKAAQESAAGGAAHKSLLHRLPHIHRPTKYELLATAEGFWQRVRINLKWFSIRSLRPYQIDEIGAFISWVFLGHVLWIIIGTTTFVSLAIWALNTVFAQETLAGWVGNYLTKSSGIKIVFESAIVPTWSSGVITFNNVFVSRRPGKQDKKQRTVSKGSTTAAAIAAEAALAERARERGDPEDDGNYSQFDVTINTVNVTLSFSKWFNGKGLLRDVEIVGVRGVIDRSSVQPRDQSIDPKSYRHEHSIGDFEIDNFQMNDVLLSIYQPNHFRPFTVSVFNCDLPRLRKQWLFYDFMSANNMSGSFDDSLFTVHPRQVHGTTGALLNDGMEETDQQWKKHSRLRIDGLKIDHLNRGVDGAFGWIREGNVDIVADVMIPSDDDNIWRQSWKKSTEAITDLYDKVEASVSSASTNGKTRTPEIQSQTINHEESGGIAVGAPPSESDKRILIFDIKVHLNDVRAHVPLFTRDLSYVNNALVRPIVAYINSRRAFIPVNCRVVKRQSEFNGSWTVFDSGLLDDLSRETYEAFARDVEDVDSRKRRMKKVGLWTIQLAAQALFIGLAGQLA